MSTLTAIVRNLEGCAWERFSDPEQVITARSAAEVLPALEAIEQASNQGLTAVGYVSYEAAPAFDPSLQCHKAKGPLLKFGLFRSAQEWQPGDSNPINLCLAPELGKPDYSAAIAQIKNHLQAGDSYQVNFTQRLSGFCPHDTEAVFTRLLANQVTDMAFYMADDEEAVCSVSPELFFRLDNNNITMQPMKGTRPRSKSSEVDQQFYRELTESEKERAENLMIVDMIRNDLGKIADSGSVRVSKLFEILEFPTVWQQVSTVDAITDASLLALFAALFPSASITGAPKAQTMKIIKQLEVSPRGVYTGALGVVRPGRQMLFNVGIRTLTVDPQLQQAHYGIGSGVVWDSEVDAEWQETLVKARVMEQQHAMQLLETLLYEPDKGVALQTFHLQRLQASAEFFGYRCPVDDIEETLNNYSAGQAMRLRLLLCEDGVYDLQSVALTGNKDLVNLRLSATPVNSTDNYLRHKTTRRQVYDFMKQQAGDCDDVLLWNERGELTETTIYNIFLDIDGELLTPAIRSGLLPGTLRRQLLETGEARETVLLKSDLARARRILVGNSVRGLKEATLTS